MYLRSFNVFNLTLWDDIMAEFGELTEQDVLVSFSSFTSHHSPQQTYRHSSRHQWHQGLRMDRPPFQA